MKDIQYTSFQSSTMLVNEGMASADDFVVFSGYCGWTEGQLKRELTDGRSWMTMAVDSGTLLRELKEQQQRQPHDPTLLQDAGIGIWEKFATLIGKNDNNDASKTKKASFDDLFLKEWARDQLVHHRSSSSRATKNLMESVNANNNDNAIPFLGGASDVEIRPGMLLRASVHPRSPFLLSDQDMHKCLFLVVSENVYGTVGVILNLPTTKTIELDIAKTNLFDNSEDDGPHRKSSSVPMLLRYGGNYVVFGEGERPLLWLHCNDALRRASVGIPLDEFNTGSVWECTPEDVASAIGKGMASPSDFMVVSGGYIWVKDNDGMTGGIRGEVWNGRFEIVPPHNIQHVWDALLSQQGMTRETFDENLVTSSMAWSVAGNIDIDDNRQSSADSLPEQPSYVFGSNVRLSLLEDEARRRWVAKYILNDPGCVAS